MQMRVKSNHLVQPIDVDASTKIWDYDDPSQKIVIATALIDGWHPTEENQVFINLEFDEVYNVTRGSDTVFVSSEDHEVSSGDIVFIGAGEWFRVFGNHHTHCSALASAYYHQIAENDAVEFVSKHVE